MKTTCCAIICLTALGLTPALAQEPSPPAPPAPAIPPHLSAPAPAQPPGGFSERLQNIIQRAGAPSPAESSLTKFNLDFPGGTPEKLVAAIEKATGRPLNAIVPDDFAETKLPALRMNNVNAAQLFQALEASSRKQEQIGNSTWSVSYGFKTEGKPSDDSIWNFYVVKPEFRPPTKTCRFYSLAPYLDSGMSVDDMSTAIETGWKMLGETSPPTISFHKDTKLLIAVGEPSKLETIDAVLKALGPPKPSPAAPAPAAKPAEKPKTDK